MMDEVSIFFFVLFAFILIAFVWWAVKRAWPRSKAFFASGYSGQMELDMRLPYKRFRELYPYSKITYQQYKEMQMKRAFKRAVSSEKNKRMVR